MSEIALQVDAEGALVGVIAGDTQFRTPQAGSPGGGEAHLQGGRFSRGEAGRGEATAGEVRRVFAGDTHCQATQRPVSGIGDGDAPRRRHFRPDDGAKIQRARA